MNLYSRASLVFSEVLAWSAAATFLIDKRLECDSFGANLSTSGLSQLSSLTECVFEFVLQKPTPQKIRQLIVYISNA